METATGRKAVRNRIHSWDVLYRAKNKIISQRDTIQHEKFRKFNDLRNKDIGIRNTKNMNKGIEYSRRNKGINKRRT